MSKQSICKHVCTGLQMTDTLEFITLFNVEGKHDI